MRRPYNGREKTTSNGNHAKSYQINWGMQGNAKGMS